MNQNQNTSSSDPGSSTIMNNAQILDTGQCQQQPQTVASNNQTINGGSVDEVDNCGLNTAATTLSLSSVETATAAAAATVDVVKSEENQTSPISVMVKSNNNNNVMNRNNQNSNNINNKRSMSINLDSKGKQQQQPILRTSNETSDSSSIIQRLLDKIEGLECELRRVKSERDALYSENERLCFQLQMINEADKQRSIRQQAAAAAGKIIECLPPSNNNNPQLSTNLLLSSSSSSPYQNECQCSSYGQMYVGSSANGSSNHRTSIDQSSTFLSSSSSANDHHPLVNSCSFRNSSINDHQQQHSSINSMNVVVSTGGANKFFPNESSTSSTATPSSSTILLCNETNNCTCQTTTPTMIPTSAIAFNNQSQVLRIGSNKTSSNSNSGNYLNNSACTVPANESYNNAIFHHHQHQQAPSTATLERSLSTHSSLSRYSIQLQFSPTSLVSPGGIGSACSAGSGNLFCLSNQPSNTGAGSSGICHVANSTNLSRTTRATGGSTTSLASNSNSVCFNNYEISQQLIDKKVSALERKYGGSQAREAAIKIQRAYRSYRLQKRFTSLAIQAIHHKQKQQQIQLLTNNNNSNNHDRLDGMNDLTCSHENNYVMDGKNNSHCQIMPPPIVSSTAVASNYYYGGDQYLTSKTQQQQQRQPQQQNVIIQPSTVLSANHNHNNLTITGHGNTAANDSVFGQRAPSIIYGNSSVDATSGGEPIMLKRQSLQKKTSFSSTSSTGSSSSLHAASSASSKPPSDRTSLSSKMSRDAQYGNNLSNDSNARQHHSHSQGQLPPMKANQFRISNQYSQSQSSVNTMSTTAIQSSPSVVNQVSTTIYKTQYPTVGASPGTVMFPSSVEYSNSHHHASLSSSATSESLVANVADIYRKRLYRVGLNLFNKTPSERGIRFLIHHNFIEQFPSMEDQAKAVAIFLLTRKGVSRQMIGEYLADNSPFNKAVLKAFSSEINLQGLIVDEALRSFQMNFRFPGEAQKIERIVDAFADRYKECNPNDVLSRDSIFILAFAIIMLNTDLHKPTNIKHRMTQEQWLNNLKNVFSEGDLSPQFLLGIYKRIKKQELQTGTDHVTQVLKVQSTIVGKDVPNLSLPHRRLVCYCRLYEIRDVNRKEKVGQHQRDVFLFNDLLLITKTTNRSRNNQLAEYQYRSSTSLDGLHVSTFVKGFYAHGIRITRRVDQKCIALFNARNELDQKRFVEDLRESIAEMDEMEQIRITKSSSLVQLNNFMSTNEDEQLAISNNQQQQSQKQSKHNNNNGNHHSNNSNGNNDDVNSYSSISSITIPQRSSGSSNGHVVQQQNYHHRNNGNGEISQQHSSTAMASLNHS